MNLKGRNFLKLMDFTPEEITHDRPCGRSESEEKTGHPA